MYCLKFPQNIHTEVIMHRFKERFKGHIYHIYLKSSYRFESECSNKKS